MIKLLKVFLLILIPTIAQASERIIAIGGVAEIVDKLGYNKNIIAVDLTAKNIRSLSLGENVKNIGYIRKINAENVIALNPDLIIADYEVGPENQVKLLKSSFKNFHVLPRAKTLDDVYKRIKITGDILGAGDNADQLISNMKSKHKLLNNKLAGVNTKTKVMAIMMHGGLLIAGGDNSSIGVMLKMAKGKNVFAGINNYTRVADEAIINMNPDVIVVLNHSMGKRKVDELYSHPAVSKTNAAKNKRIHEIPIMNAVSFGTETVDAMETLAKMFYPNKFN